MVIMATRKIVQIDESKCNGCGDCIPNCAEGAIQLVGGKARLVKDTYCDGLGACLGTCPQDAIRVVEREAAPFDQAEATRHAERAQAASVHAKRAHAGCPGMAVMEFEHAAQDAGDAPDDAPSALTQWPVQLMLVPPHAPFLDGADVLLAADCVPFAYAGFHNGLLRGRKLLVGCPKLDDSALYAQKLAEMLRLNDVRSLTVAHMEVPCCYGLMALARRALAESGKDMPLSEVTISVRGEIKG